MSKRTKLQSNRLGDDIVKDFQVDWGIEAGDINAEDMPILDIGNKFTATTVEGALTEIVDNTGKSAKGKFEVTISEYDTTNAPVVKAGSVFENAGNVINVGIDTTPSGYSGISNSTSFYIVYDLSEEELIYSETAPTWSDDKQGWYNGDDRYLFSMYKDNGGTLYQNKRTMMSSMTKLFRQISMDNGTNQDRTIDFASDASLKWDESEDEFVFSKRLKLTYLRLGSGSCTASSNLQDMILAAKWRSSNYKGVHSNSKSFSNIQNLWIIPLVSGTVKCGGGNNIHKATNCQLRIVEDNTTTLYTSGTDAEYIDVNFTVRAGHLYTLQGKGIQSDNMILFTVDEIETPIFSASTSTLVPFLRASSGAHIGHYNNYARLV